MSRRVKSDLEGFDLHLGREKLGQMVHGGNQLNVSAAEVTQIWQILFRQDQIVMFGLWILV
jgi:hypothetical protein